MESTSALQIENLTVQLASKTVLQEISVTMPRGAIGLLGPNGAGKSTLLKTVMGFIPPAKGTALVFGYNCAKQGAEVRQMIG
ncbi:MAG TPA: ATP-binding cassette domain-containing protein, partial [bacterium]|nr:ATP-binding cassette domain-containing protein [bacterium]